MSGAPFQSNQIPRQGAIRRLSEYLEGAGAYQRSQASDDDGANNIQGVVPVECCLDHLRVRDDRLRSLIKELSCDKTTPIEYELKDGQMVVLFKCKKDSMEAFIDDYRSDHPFKN